MCKHTIQKQDKVVRFLDAIQILAHSTIGQLWNILILDYLGIQVVTRIQLQKLFAM